MARLFMKSRRVLLDVYDEYKYTAADDVKTKEVVLEHCTGFDVVGDKDALEIEKHTDSIDDLHEYLVLFFEDGTTSTYRNSYTDLFVL